MESNQVTFHSIDEYIATFPAEIQKKLEEVRAAIKATVPEAGETISYNMPAFTLDGKYFIAFAGWKKHIAIYPIPSGDEAFNREAAKYIAGKGTLQFPLDGPLPLELIGQAAGYLAAAKKASKKRS